MKLESPVAASRGGEGPAASAGLCCKAAMPAKLRCFPAVR